MDAEQIAHHYGVATVGAFPFRREQQRSALATHGGGGAADLATQRECPDILGCYGEGKVNRLAEIGAAVAWAGEISPASAIFSSDWVWSREQNGWNR